MAADKKSFLLYCDLINVVNKLVEKDRVDGTNYGGELFLLILEYVNDKNPVPIDFILELVFEPIKTQLKRDLKSWETEIEEKINGGKLGNLKRWNKDLHRQVISNKITLEEAEKIAIERKINRTVSDSDKNNAIPKESVASIAVTVNDTVNVTVTDIKEDIIKERANLNLEERKIAFGKSLQEFEKIYPREILAEFYDYWRETKPNGTKMRWEFETTFNVGLRLKRWAKNNLNNKPNNEGIKIDWEVEKKNFLNDTVWQMKISQEKSIKKEVLDSYITKFISDIEVKDDYKAVAGLKKHFVNSLPKFMSDASLNSTKKSNGSHIPQYQGEDLQKLMDKFS